jgi:hypothetical protein
MPLIVVMDGGMISAVVSDDNRLVGMPVDIIDYDTDGAEDEDLVAVHQGDGSSVDAYHCTMRVERPTIRIPRDYSGAVEFDRGDGNEWD